MDSKDSGRRITQDLFSIAGKVAVVTGGSRGHRFDDRPGVRESGSEGLYLFPQERGLRQVAADLSKMGTCTSVARGSLRGGGNQSLGRRRRGKEKAVHILVNNAGTNWGPPWRNTRNRPGTRCTISTSRPSLSPPSIFCPFSKRGAGPETPARVINIGSIDGIRRSFRGKFRLLGEQGGCSSPDPGPGPASGQAGGSASMPSLRAPLRAK